MVCACGRLLGDAVHHTAKRGGGGRALRGLIPTSVRPKAKSPRLSPAELPAEFAQRRAAVKGASRPTPAGG